MQVESQEAAEMGAWMEHKITKASDWLKIVTLKELIIRKSLARWEEGLRLAHKQWEIGEAAVRMETMSDHPILMLKLSDGEHKWLEAWRKRYLGQPKEFEGE